VADPSTAHTDDIFLDIFNLFLLLLTLFGGERD
jgi:hypothetical protein